MGRIILLLVFLLIFVVWLARKRQPAATERDDALPAMEARFYEEISQGKAPCRFLRIYSQFDAVIIKSLLATEDIPFRVDFENMNNLFPGLPIENFNQILVTILDEDYPRALETVRDYLEDKQKNGKDSVLRNTAEGLLFGWYVPSAGSMGGVEIILKEGEE